MEWMQILARLGDLLGGPTRNALSRPSETADDHDESSSGSQSADLRPAALRERRARRRATSRARHRCGFPDVDVMECELTASPVRMKSHATCGTQRTRSTRQSSIRD
jgi:hypothetical protein